MSGDQLSIDDALNDYRCDVCGWYPGWGGDNGCGHGVSPGRVIPSRSSDPDTSRAAEPVKIKAGTQRARLLEAFHLFDVFGGTDEQAMKAAHHVSAVSEYAKRCSELRDGGYIEPTGETRTGAAGAARIVSRITPKGMEWIRENADDGIGL